MKIKLKRKLLLLTFFVALTTTACGVNEKKSLNNVDKDMQKIVKFENMKKGNKKDIRRFYNLNANDYEDVVLYTPTSPMDVSEVLMVKVKDKSQVEQIEDSIDSRINFQLKSFSNYGPKQCALVNDYELKVKGKFVFFAISEKAEKFKSAFLHSVK